VLQRIKITLLPAAVFRAFGPGSYVAKKKMRESDLARSFSSPFALSLKVHSQKSVS
jgi:hypothetical protein